MDLSSIEEPVIYKILTQDEWAEFQKTGVFEGADIDKQDGFIHTSTEKQWPDVRRKFFSNYKDVVLVELDTHKLAPHIRWEKNYPGATEAYPHLYNTKLTMEMVKRYKTVVD